MGRSADGELFSRLRWLALACFCYSRDVYVRAFPAPRAHRQSITCRALLAWGNTATGDGALSELNPAAAEDRAGKGEGGLSLRGPPDVATYTVPIHNASPIALEVMRLCFAVQMPLLRFGFPGRTACAVGKRISRLPAQPRCIHGS